MATTKKTTTTAAKKTTAAAKKTVKAAETKAVKAEASAPATKTTAAKKTTASKKYMYVFFNCNDNKDAASMNIRYNNEAFADTVAGRKALLKKVEDEAAAGRVNVSDAEAVKNEILKGEPTDASAKLQYGDIERLVVVA
ncbi:hypothetical protein [Selenomonas sp. AB3002]|uniref:hypothetical protein n=1 Tax=Selenomonas sp. AB3002 TaxID=1392502 RepID=UPI0006907E7E